MSEIRLSTMASDAGRDRSDAIPRGIVFRTFSVAGLACMAAGAKLAGEQGVNMWEIVFYRCLFPLPLLFCWISFGRHRAELSLKSLRFQLLPSFLSLSAMALLFQAVQMLDLPEATVINFSAPFFATLISAVLLREAVSPQKWIALVAGLVGVVIVIQPSGAGTSLAGAAVAVAAAVVVACATVTLRRVTATQTPFASTIWFSIIGTSIAGMGMPWFANMHSAETWIILASIGILGVIAQLFFTYSLRFAPVSMLAPFDYLQLVWASLLAWWLWADKPSGATIAGALLIMASSLFSLYSGDRRRPSESS